jgi:hypothetical protein
MGLSETILFYLLFGVAVAAAVAIGREKGGRPERVFRIATALFFWPLYIPLLLDRPARPRSGPQPQQRPDEPPDQFDVAIAQVEAELETALDSLDGWAENVLAREQSRIAELRAAWRTQAARIRELDRLLAVQDTERLGAGDEAAAEFDSTGARRSRQSEQARRENLERLHGVRRQLHDDLMGTLAWVRELVSMIHLAKFTGAPASRAEELVSQIATAVEGLSEATGQMALSGPANSSQNPWR